MRKKILFLGFTIVSLSLSAHNHTDSNSGWGNSADRAPKRYGDAKVTGVVSVYDGDTFRANIAGFPPIIGESMPIRLAGVDTPEIRDKDPIKKQKAIIARDFVRNLLYSAKSITLKNLRRGKYFRMVADVHLVTKSGTKKDLAEELLLHGHAVPYLKNRPQRVALQ